MHNSTERSTAAAAPAGLFYSSDSTAAHNRRDETKTQGPGPKKPPRAKKPNGCASRIHSSRLHPLDAPTPVHWTHPRATLTPHTHARQPHARPPHPPTLHPLRTHTAHTVSHTRSLLDGAQTYSSARGSGRACRPCVTRRGRGSWASSGRHSRRCVRACELLRGGSAARPSRRLRSGPWPLPGAFIHEMWVL